MKGKMKMNDVERKKYIRWCITGAIGVAFVAAGDWLLGCVPLQEGDDGMFNRAYYLSGEYGLWRSVLVIGLGVIGAWLYYFALKAIHADINAKCKTIKRVHYCCGVCTFAVLLTIHTWSATLAWFASYLGPRIGSDAAVSTVTAYQNDTLIAILPMYIPMVLFILIHFLMMLCGKTKYPRIMALLHPVTINIILVLIPDIAQAIHKGPETWMSVMSQSSTNTSIIIWCIAAAVFERRRHAEKTFSD